ncbi:MAG TPA: metal-dependent hydrolase, partial [Verrucomicrobiae bacterium]
MTHFLGSWLVAVTVSKDPRDRALITWAGVLPDADGLGVVADVIKSVATGQECKFEYYQHYHHLLLHGWPGALLMAGLLTLWARRKGVVFVWALVTFHLHLLCDYLGSRGPTVGDRWPICYSEPLFRHPIWFWKYQW